MTKEAKIGAGYLALAFFILAAWRSYELGKHTADHWWQAHQATIHYTTDPTFTHDYLVQVNPPDAKGIYTITFPGAQKGICGYEVRRDSPAQYTFKPIAKCKQPMPRCPEWDSSCGFKPGDWPSANGNSAGVPIGSQPYTIKQGDCVRIDSDGTMQKVYKIPCWDDSESTYCHEKFDPKCKLLTDHGPVPKP